VRGCTPVNERDSSVCVVQRQREIIQGSLGGRASMVGERGEREEGMTNPHVATAAAAAAAVKVR